MLLIAGDLMIAVHFFWNCKVCMKIGLTLIPLFCLCNIKLPQADSSKRSLINKLLEIHWQTALFYSNTYKNSKLC